MIPEFKLVDAVTHYPYLYVILRGRVKIPIGGKAREHFIIQFVILENKVPIW
jgi:hypothetical protein